MYNILDLVVNSINTAPFLHTITINHGSKLFDFVIMPSKKVMKGAPKCGEKVNPTDTRPKIVVETVNSPDVSVEEVPFDVVESPQDSNNNNSSC
jgi:hypothetical protein